MRFHCRIYIVGGRWCIDLRGVCGRRSLCRLVDGRTVCVWRHNSWGFALWDCGYWGCSRLWNRYPSLQVFKVLRVSERGAEAQQVLHAVAHLCTGAVVVADYWTRILQLSKGGEKSSRMKPRKRKDRRERGYTWRTEKKREEPSGAIQNLRNSKLRGYNHEWVCEDIFEVNAKISMLTMAKLTC